MKKKKSSSENIFYLNFIFVYKLSVCILFVFEMILINDKNHIRLSDNKKRSKFEECGEGF